MGKKRNPQNLNTIYTRQLYEFLCRHEK